MPTREREQRVMIETEPDGKTPTADGLVEHAAQSQAVDIACLHAKANDPPAELVHDDQYPVSFQENRLRPKQVQAPETILRVAQEREPRQDDVAPADAEEAAEKARHARSLSISAPKVLASCCAILGQPKRGLRCLSPTMAWISSRAGPLGPGAPPLRGLNSKRYLCCLSAA